MEAENKVTAEQEQTVDIEAVKAKRVLLSSRVAALNAKRREVKKRHEDRMAALDDQAAKVVDRLLVFDEKYYAILHPGRKAGTTEPEKINVVFSKGEDGPNIPGLEAFEGMGFTVDRENLVAEAPWTQDRRDFAARADFHTPGVIEGIIVEEAGSGVLESIDLIGDEPETDEAAADPALSNATA